MQTPLQRRRMLARMGIAPPMPSVRQRRLWEFIDDSTPPAGEADGEFTSFVQWVNKAASWIGFTGAKCYDAKDRRCDDGAAFQRARDEDAFPVRWYLPERFPQGEPMDERLFQLLSHLHQAGPDGLTARTVADRLSLKTTRSLRIPFALEEGLATQEGETLRITPKGTERAAREARSRRRALSIRN